MRTAVYPLTADPVHRGHVWVIQEAAKLFDKLYVALGENPEKKNKHLFSIEERVNFVKKSIDFPNVEVEHFSGLLAHYAKEKDAVIVRGCRSDEDFRYEHKMAEFNSKYGLTTVVLPSQHGKSVTSSSALKAMVSEGCFVHEYTHPAVKQALEEKIQNISFVSVTGNSGAGKTYFCRELTKRANEQGLKTVHLDMDELIKSLYKKDSVYYPQIKEDLKELLGSSKEFDLKSLGKDILGDEQKRKKLAEILKTPTTIELEKFVRDNEGLVLFDCAYLVEQDMLPLVNYNVIQVVCDEEKRKQRIIERDDLSNENLEARIKAQLPQEEIKKRILQAQKEQKHGFYLGVDSENIDYDCVIDGLKAHFPLLRNIKAELEQEWNAVVGDDHKDIFDDVVRQYSNRQYHDLKHVYSMIQELKQCPIKNRKQVFLAACYHDAVYVPGAKDNEEKSTKLAYDACLKLGHVSFFAREVSDLIMSTKNHETRKVCDEDYFIDADLAILGKSDFEFDEYEENIRKEYSSVPEQVYNYHRVEILRSFLDKRYIYHTKRFRDLYEDRARANLKRAIRKLKS